MGIQPIYVVPWQIVDHPTQLVKMFEEITISEQLGLLFSAEYPKLGGVYQNGSVLMSFREQNE